MMIILVALLVISFLIIVISILMSSNAEGFSGALVGSSDLDLFRISKERGSKKIFKWAFFILGILLMFGAILIRMYM